MLWVQFGALGAAEEERVREGDPGQLEESGLYRPLSGGRSDPFFSPFFSPPFK